MNEFEKHYSGDLEAVTLHGVTFHVKLPTMSNKRFQRAVTAAMVEPSEEDAGELRRKDINLAEMVDIQIAAFVRTCIRKVDNWPEYTPEHLLGMEDACEDLWEAVTDITRAREAAADDGAKKSQAISDGPTNGEENKISTPPLNAVAT